MAIKEDSSDLDILVIHVRKIDYLITRVVLFEDVLLLKFSLNTCNAQLIPYCGNS